ncbi:MAG: hypothetical protein IJ043_07755 [Clostridia bacterium]|nr:hypothetical protein [Clostridia bacterium]
MDITKIDRNFEVETKIERDGLTFYDVEDAPFTICGVQYIDGKYRRLPEAVAKATSDGVHHLHTHTAGGRVRFVTDSPYIAISAQMENLGKMAHFPFTASIGFDLYTGKHYLKTYVPPLNVTDGFEGIVDIPDPCEREYTINFPLYSGVNRLYVGIKVGSVLKAAPAYDLDLPIVYYGSSITQGGCASRPGNAYQSIIGRELNCDHINLGFSGNAKGEEAITDYIAGLDMAAFVYDYDHNAPNPDHLQATHEKMFRKIRAAHPDLPILMLTRPKYYLTSDEIKRLTIVRQTYEKALAAGDKNVYFIPGPDLLIDLVRETALVDNCHPNDSGFVSMAYVIGEKLKEILKKR